LASLAESEVVNLNEEKENLAELLRKGAAGDKEQQPSGQQFSNPTFVNIHNNLFLLIKFSSGNCADRNRAAELQVDFSFL
jgi:hypothetical protein